MVALLPIMNLSSNSIVDPTSPRIWNWERESVFYFPIPGSKLYPTDIYVSFAKQKPYADSWHCLLHPMHQQGWLTSHTALRWKARNFLEKTKVNSSEILPFFRHQTIQFWMLKHHLMMKEAGISKLTNQSSRSTISLYKLKCNLLAPSKMTNLVQNLI